MARTRLDPNQRSWRRKFQCAWRGVRLGVLGSATASARQIDGQSSTGEFGGHRNSFLVHAPAAAVVLAGGLWCGLTSLELGVLVLCIGLVMVAELLNSGLEFLSRAITSESNEHVRSALDVAGGAVLVASLFATVAGGCLFWRPLRTWLLG